MLYTFYNRSAYSKAMKFWCINFTESHRVEDLRILQQLYVIQQDILKFNIIN
jgi:hypothetical protein